MRAILIDPYTCIISDTEIDGKDLLNDCYRKLDCVNTPEPYDTIEKLDADEIRRNEIDKDDENPF